MSTEQVLEMLSMLLQVGNPGPGLMQPDLREI